MKGYTWALVAMLVVGVVAAIGVATAFDSTGTEAGNIGGIGGAGPHGQGSMHATSAQMQAVQAAIQANDYEAYKTAVTAIMNDQLSQDHFNQLVTMSQSRKDIAAAVQAGDYTAYTNAMTKLNGASGTAKVLTQDQFNKLVARVKAHGTTPMNGGKMMFGRFRGHAPHGWNGNSTTTP